jgi:hypothetical protein
MAEWRGVLSILGNQIEGITSNMLGAALCRLSTTQCYKSQTIYTVLQRRI